MGNCPEKFEVGDVVVCVDASEWAGVPGMDILVKGKAYEVLRVSIARDIFVPESHRAWKSDRFRRATLDEIRKYRKEQGYEKHHFAVGDIVVGIASNDPYSGRSFEVRSVETAPDREMLVGVDGHVLPVVFASRFRKATPAEAEAYRKAKEKATASLVAGTTIVPGQLVTVQISDKPPFKAVVLEAPTANDPYVKLSRAAGVAWATKAELAPTFNLTFTWNGPEKMPLTGNDAPEAINKAIAVPNPQVLTSSDGREFEIIDWRPTVRTGEIVTVETKLLPLVQKPFEVLKAAVAAPEAPKPVAPAQPAWQPKPGDLVVCKDAGHSSGVLEAGKVYEVSGKVAKCDKSGQKIVLQGTSLGVGRESGWYTNRFRPATPEEICDYHKEKGFPDHKFNVGDIVVAVDVRVADGTQIAPDFAVGSVHKVEYRSGIGIRVSGCDRQGFWNATRFRKATLDEINRFFNEKLDKEGPGDGYRLLGKEERLDESDEVFDAEKGTWVFTIRVGETAGTGPNRYRRRNKFAEGELVQIVKPATEQERDSDPVWTPMMDHFDGAVFPMPATEPITGERDGIYYAGWVFATDWLAPATKDQKAKKAKIQELEDKMKDIQSELSSLKGT